MTFDHPGYSGYLPHLRKAAGWSLRLLWAGLAVGVHSLLPCFFKTTASRTIRDLHRSL